ncbi:MULTISPECIES: GtrA family protein [unclassified Arthrobacter]|uniref:GtrA family protein n=1 Tax=unclassified Arthrobacter TaxID=235627 RepID=UPI002096CB52|nr:GtrA family protein [Arthrobacter sp. H16F315]MDD1477059.1 GtrA family protein [Arthrobacter sp. H16F315]
MRDSSMSLVRRFQHFVRNGHLVKFLIVGAASFAIDLGLLALLHEGAGVDLWIATPVAFLASLVFNFLVQRKFTFQSDERAHVSFLKYGALVVFNVVATDIIVNVVAGSGQSYAIGKVIATVATTGWNFLLYKHWIFKAAPVADDHIDVTAAGTPSAAHERPE